MDIRKRVAGVGELIEKKIPYGRDLMKPKKEWMKTVAEKDCDFVMLMSPSAAEAAVNWVHLTMQTYMPELRITLKNYAATKSVAFHIQATHEGLVKGGEAMRLKKKTKSEFGSDLIELSQKELSMFENSDDEASFFTTQERQSISFYILHSFRAPDENFCPHTSMRRGQAMVAKLLSKGIIKRIFPLHESVNLKPLRSKWVRGFLKRQPIDEIQQYFGSHLAMYCSWLGHYTIALTIPALLGIIFWFLPVDDLGLVAFAFLNVVWASTWLESWKRRSAEHAFTWGTLDVHLGTFSEPRPSFKGEMRVSHVTGRWEPFYPTWKRNLFRYLVSLPLIMGCMYIVFCVMLYSLDFQETCKEHLLATESLAFIASVPKVLMAVPISIFDKLYTKLAHWLTKKENYRSEEDHQNHLILKLLVFRFVNSFLSLFYIAFYLQDVAALREQLAALLVTKQLTGNLKESIIPYLKKRLQLVKMSFKLFGSGSDGRKSEKSSEKEKLSDDEDDVDECTQGQEGSSDPAKDRQIQQAEVESKMLKYDGTYKDYLELFIQFGYVTLFSSAFPLAAACALFTNIIEIRSDAFKFCYVYQRPFGRQAQNIGVWQDAMELMGVISITVNCALIGLSGQVQSFFPDITSNQTILFIVVLEHVLIALKYGISYAIPGVPNWVEEEVAKKEFDRREALKGTPTGKPKES